VPVLPRIAALFWLVPRALWLRLALLMLVATGPMLGLLLVSAMGDGRRVLDAAGEQALQMARLAGEQQNDSLQEATNLLAVLARVGAVRDMSVGACGDLLRDVVADHPRLNAIAVAQADGHVACGSRPGANGLYTGDRSYFQQAMASDGGRAVVSNIMVSRVSNQPTIFVAVPISQGGRGVGVLIASLNLSWFSHLGDRLPVYGDQLVQMFDSRDGAILARTPDRSARIGTTVPGHPVLQAARTAPSGGVVAAPDLDGTRRIFGFAPLPGQGGDIIVAIGLAEGEVLAAAQRRSGYAVVVALGSVAFAVVAGWLVAERALLRPIRSLAAAVQQVGTGDMTAHARMNRGAARELRALASSFARMARRLGERDSRIARMAAQLATSEAHHRLLADTATDVIVRLDPDFRHAYVSPSCQEVLGCLPGQMTGRPLSDAVAAEDWPLVEAELVQPLAGGQVTARATYRARRGDDRDDGTVTWIESSGRRLADGTGYVLVSRDVSARKLLEDQLEDANRQLRVLVRQDGLTGLGNRRHFDDMLGTEYRRAMRVKVPLALILVDVDRFKAYNDFYGHPAGDACLRAVSAALAGSLRRPADLAARYGGEEFAVLLPSTDEAGAMATAVRIQDAVRAAAVPHSASEFAVVTVSMGVAVLAPGSYGDGPAALVEAADAALYGAKRAGRNTALLMQATPA